MVYPRILIAAGASGSGKTLITCGILKAFCNRGMTVASFKCGPDYIDPMFHSKVIGTKARNLDTFFTDDETTRYLFQKTAKEADLSIMEGVMGYYDGLGGISSKASTYDVAKVTHTPVIFVVNAKGMSVSVIPYIQGFLQYRQDSHISGIILNQISGMFYPQIKKMIEEELNIPVYGYVPKMENLQLTSRHLGLVMPDEVKDLQQKLDALAVCLEETLELDGLVSLAESASDLDELTCFAESQSEWKEKNIKVTCIVKDKKKVRIAVARDEAFCFIYEDNLDVLREMGAELVEFSPIRDKEVPINCSGLLLYGGYPELFAKELSENESMKNSIKKAIYAGIPCMAECGGFMYLHTELEDMYGTTFPMVGVIEGKSYYTKKLSRFGYIELIPRKEQMLEMDMGMIKGHEFHYFDSTTCGEAFEAKKPLRNRSWNCIHGEQHLIAGFPHLYYYSNLKVPKRFLGKCIDFQKTMKSVSNEKI